MPDRTGSAKGLPTVAAASTGPTPRDHPDTGPKPGGISYANVAG